MFGYSIVLAVAVMASAPAWGQDRPATRPIAKPAQRGTAVSMRDQDLAHCIAGANRNEVELAKFASAKLESKGAKEFAQTMIKDHTKGWETFSKFDSQTAAKPTVKIDVATEPADERPVATTDIRVAGDKVGLNWRQIHEEIGQKCLASAKKELDRYEGTDFDKAYLGHQVAAHMQMLDMLQVFEKHASQDLQSEIAKAIDVTEDHLNRARELMDDKKDEK
jgi:predicted outer membrane protein